MKNSDTGAGIVLALFSLAGIVYISQQGYKSTVGLSPGFFPTFVLVVLGLCGVVLFAKSVTVEKDKTFIPVFAWKKLLPVIVMLAVYMFAMEYIGFIISTLIFMVVTMLFYGERRKKYLALVPIATTAFIFLVFTEIFNIPLP